MVVTAHHARDRSDTRHDYAWDALDRLVASKPEGAPVWEEVHHYDAQGRLLLTQRNGITERFVYDGLQKVALYDGQGDLQWRAVWGAGLDELVWWHDVAGGHSYIPITDGMKSVVGLWNEQTAKMDHVRSFDPRGQVTQWSPQEVATCQERADCTSPGVSCAPCEFELPTANAGAPSPTRFGFGWHSAWRSPTTGLVQMRQRWYSPRLGQFTSHDPLEYADSFNLFAFAGRDPVNGWDPMGLGRWGFAGEFWDGVEEGAAKEAIRQADEVGKAAESMKQTAKEMAENWEFGLDGKVWGDALEEMRKSVEDMAKGATHGGVECVANPEACLAESGPAKRLKAYVLS